MKTIQYSAIYKSRPLWMGDEPEYEQYIPGGARLRKESVPGADKTVSSGSLVGRTAINRDFELIPPTATKTGGNFVTSNTAALIQNAAVGSNVIKLANTDGFKVGTPLTIAGTSNTITAVGIDGSLTLSTALTTALPVGTVVSLATATPYVELFLTATEITDVTDNCEFTQYRLARMVYINFLPGFNTYSPDVLNTVKTLYHYITAQA